MWWKWLFCGLVLVWVLTVVVILITVWREDWKDRKAKKLAGWLDYKRMNDQLGALLRNYADDRQISKRDMDILSKRITNAFNYIHLVEQSHLAQFHPIHLPKWNPVLKKKGKK